MSSAANPLRARARLLLEEQERRKDGDAVLAYCSGERDGMGMADE